MSDDRIDRYDGMAIAAGRIPPDAPAASTVVGMTKAVGAYPTVASSWYAISPLGVDGTEEEGSAAAFVPIASMSMTAFNIGSSAPPVGTKLLCFSIGGRWVFRYDG